jgi:hypothetical protein
VTSLSRRILVLSQALTQVPPRDLDKEKKAASVRFLGELAINIDSKDLLELLSYEIEEPARIPPQAEEYAKRYPIHSAIRGDDIESLKKLPSGDDLKKYAKFDSEGKSPLCYAAENNNVEAVRVLLEKKFDIYEINSEEKDALFLIVEEGRLEILKFLLENKKEYEIYFDGHAP